MARTVRARQPGPACYAAGGTEATVTDCYLVAGYIDPAHFLGGRLALDVAAARRALENVADALGVAGEERAERVALIRAAHRNGIDGERDRARSCAEG